MQNAKNLIKIMMDEICVWKNNNKQTARLKALKDFYYKPVPALSHVAGFSSFNLFFNKTPGSQEPQGETSMKAADL